MNLGASFLIGLIGSLHCAAMCGPLMLALPVPAGGAGRFIAGRVVYQLGRIWTYCVLGVVAGLVGKSIFLAGMQRWASIALGVAILAGYFISKKVAAAGFVVRLVTRLKAGMSAQLQRRTLSSLGLLGMLNGLLPCGLVYVALAAAVTEGTIPSAVANMAAFGLGTLPMMLAMSLSGKMLPLAWRNGLRAAVPVGVCIIAALLILRGLELDIPYISPGPRGCCH